MDIKRGDIFYVKKMPIVGAEHEAGRPAVIVSSNRHNRLSRVVEVIYLTTKEKDVMPEHFITDATGIESTTLCEQITTIDISRVGTYITHLSSKDLEAIEKGCLYSLGLERYIKEAEKNASANENSVSGLDVAKIQIERDMYRQLYESLLEKMIK